METLAWFIIIGLLAVIITLIVVTINKVKATITKKKAVKTAPKIKSIYHWVIDTENADKFEKAYKHDFIENDDYHLSAKELKEDYCNEKVYQYEPMILPLKLDGLDVYSYIDKDEWIKVGRLKKNADIDGKLILRLFPNTYKYVTENSVEKENEEAEQEE